MDMCSSHNYNEIFESWEVSKFLGGGGFGEVYELQRVEGNKVFKSALKVISIPKNKNEIAERKAEGYDEESLKQYYNSIVKMYLNEYSIMADLRGNSNIVSYEDHKVVPHDDGIGCNIFIRMELLVPLVDYLADNDLTEEIIVKLGIDICRALELCEKRNIIHRDIKPGNIFLSKNNDFKLGDFGIARSTEATLGELSKKGTYKYMAPEVYKGENYGRTVDMYSLGLVMYFLANGRRTPFLPPEPERVTYIDEEKALLMRVQGKPLPPPRNAGRELSRIILKACAYEADDRYLSAAEMRMDLENIGRFNSFNYSEETGEETVNDVPPIGYVPEWNNENKAKKQVSKQRLKFDKRIIAIIAVLLVIAAGAVFAFGPKDGDDSKDSLFSSDLPMIMYDTGVRGTWGDNNGMEKQKLLFDRFERDSIVKIVFTDSIKDAEGEIVDISEEQNEEALAWIGVDEPGLLYIGGKGGVKANSNCSGLFAYCGNLRSVDFNNAFDTSDVTEMRYMFYHDENLRSIDMEGIDTSNVTIMDRMFAFCNSLETIKNMDFDTSNVKDMIGMFKDCKNLDSIDTSSWDTSNVRDMWKMFENCYNLEVIDTSGWNSENVRGMQYMFYNCYNLSNLDVSGFDTSQATNMTAMFSHCESLANLDVSGFNTSNVASMKYMFVSCISAKLIDVSGFNTSLLDDEDVYHIFYDCNPKVVKGYEKWKEYDSYDSNRMFDLGE